MVAKEFKNKKNKMWWKYNIFDFRLGDSIAYFCLYILVPVIITTVSIMDISDSPAPAAYCYLSILVSALNSIYDNFLRWTPKDEPTFKNAKLLCLLIPNLVVGAYCLIEVFVILATQSVIIRFDVLLLVYAISIFVAAGDFIHCVIKRVVEMCCIKELMEVC